MIALQMADGSGIPQNGDTGEAQRMVLHVWRVLGAGGRTNRCVCLKSQVQTEV
jgi:hypothetical protein